MNPRAVRPILLCVVLAAVVGGAPAPASDTAAQAVAGFAGAIASDDEVPPDPFPIRRIRAAEAHLPELLKQLEPGPLIHLPRAEFENRVRTAGRAAAEARVLPRITDTRFQARLAGGDLIGMAEFDLVNPTSAPRFLPLDPLRLALGPATWGDGREAVIGIPPGATSAAVWVDRPGRQTLQFSWSLAGTVELGEQRFELRVPTAATASMALELPPGQTPSTAAPDVLLTGPFSNVAEPQKKEWRFRFGGRPRLDFSVRAATSSGVPAATALVARYDIAPGQLAGAFEYDLRPSRGTVGEWAFTVDPGLRITDVVANNRAGWMIDPPAEPGGQRTVRVSLHQPGAGGKVLLSAVAPFPDPSRPTGAPLPCVRPVGTNPDDEKIEIRLAPGFKLETWQPGDYRLVDTQVLADQGRALTLTGTLLPTSAKQEFRRLPSLGVAPAEVDFSTAEEIAWRFDADRAAVTARYTLRVRRGTLFQFALRAPAGYDFLRVSSSQEDLINHTETAGAATTVEFSRPLNTGQSVELAFEFRGPSLAAAQSMPFPVFVPVAAAERAGVLGILPGPLWHVEPAPGVGAQRAAWFDPAEPRIPPGATAAYRYRAVSPEGAVNVSPVRAEFSAETTTAVAPFPGGLFGKTMIHLRVRGGGLATLLVVEPNPGATQRAWRLAGSGNAVMSAVLLPVQGLVNPLVRTAGWPGRVALGGAGEPSGRVWLIRFARPVTGEVSLETTATRTLPGDATTDALRAATDDFARWLVPGATLNPNSPIVQSAGPGGEPPADPWRFSGLYLVTTVREQSSVMVIFGGTIDSSAATSLPIVLPRGAELRAAGVGGRWLEPGGCRLSEGGVARLPVPGKGPVRFEVRYRLPAADLTSRLESPAPVLPGGPELSESQDASSVQRWWVFANDVLPGWPMRAWHRASPADLPGFLGDSPASWGSGLVVTRMALDEVRVGTARLADTVGLAAAAGLVVLVWVGARRSQPLWSLSSVGLLLVLGAVQILGPPWWQRAAATPLVVGLIAVAAMVVVRGRRAVLPLAAGLIAFTQLDTHAQSTSPAIVVLATDTEGREMVVAPKSVLDRLSIAPASPGVVLPTSSYAIQVDDAGARVTATFTAHALDEGEGEPVASLPLADARLEKVLVNGSAAFPAAPRPGVYTVPLPGKGRHEVVVSFTVPLGGAGAERELRFGVPECPTTRIAAKLPASARQAQVMGRIGRRSSPQDETEGARVKLEADLGATKAVHLRWREGMGAQAGATASLKFREGCVWDVSESGAELTACYLTRIEQGTVGSFQINVPAELDTLAVVVRSLDLAGTAALRDWIVGAEEGGYRPLRIDLQAPSAGPLLVVLTCAPRTPITRQPLLRFPKPVLPAGAGEPDAAYGLRTRGVSVEDPGRGGVIDFAPDALLRDFGSVIGRQEPDAPIRVFRPISGATPELRPTLRVAGEPPAATLETTWTIGPHRGDAAGTIHWTGKDAPAMLEFTLPGVQVAEVRGAEVASWGKSGSRVQVWFRRSTREGQIEWSGTMAVSKMPFTTATPRAADCRLVSDTVRLRAAAGHELAIERDQGWSPFEIPGEPLARRTTNADAPPVRVVVAAAPSPSPSPAGPRGDEPTRSEALAPHPTPDPAGPPAAPNSALAPPNPTLESPRLAWPLSAAAEWLVAGLLLAVLIARFPGATWPEQFGLVTALLGVAALGSWWIGLAGWSAARLAWLADRTRRSAPAAA